MNRIVFPFPPYPLAGDISSEPGSNYVTVTGLQRISVSSEQPNDGDVLVYTESGSPVMTEWIPTPLASAAGGFRGVVKLTNNYTTGEEDSGYLLSLDGSASPVLVLTLPNPPPIMSPAWWIYVENIGPGASVDPNGLNIDNDSGVLSLDEDTGFFLTTDGTDYFTERGVGGGGGGGSVTSVSASYPLASSGGATPDITLNPIVGFIINSGLIGTNVGPMLAARQAGQVIKCVITVKTSDASVDLTFKIKKNGTDVFSSDPTITHGTASGTVVTSTSLTSVPLSVAANDVFSIDITSGSSTWQFTAQLE